MILKFKTGRGGRYYNAGHVTFITFEEMTTDALEFNELLPKLDENCDPVIEGGKEVFFHDNGNEVDYDINEDGTGYVNIDYDYDRTDWVDENDLSPKQISALKYALEEFRFMDSEKDEIRRILELNL